MMAGLQIEEVSGEAVEPWLEALGGLRIRVFREYPYLYDGSIEYERDYLAVYQHCPRSRVVLVTDPARGLVGATTCMPLADEAPEFQAPFRAAGIDVGGFLYFGESVVLREWRGRGLGREFFARREAHARRLGLRAATFCAIDRPADHPLRPPDYRPLDGFWAGLGYTRQPELTMVLSWKEIGEAGEAPKNLTFWTKSWNG